MERSQALSGASAGLQPPHPLTYIDPPQDWWQGVPLWFDDLGEHKKLLFDSVINLNAKVVLETGTRWGNSTRILASALAKTGGKLWTMDIDLPTNNWPSVYPPACPTTFLHGSSLYLPWNQPIDLLFLDGDHTYAVVVRELEQFHPFMKPGGMILLHDTAHPEYREQIHAAMMQYCTNHNTPYWFVQSGHGMGIIGCPPRRKA